MTSDWQIGAEELARAREVVAAYLPPTPLRSYPQLDAFVAHGVQVLVKHENFQPTGAFKARNGLVAMAWLTEEERAKGVVTATRGNHGQGLAWAGGMLGAQVTVFVPRGNNPEKNEAMVALGAELVEVGENYDEALAAARERVATTGATLVHPTDNRGVLAGAATIGVEVFEQDRDVDTFVISVGGGSQAVGVLSAARAMGRQVELYGVQAAAASTIHDSWHAGRSTPGPVGPTLADGLATGAVYEATFGQLQAGLSDFVTVTEEEIAETIRTLLRATHTLVEGGGAAGLAGLRKLAPRLAGRRVAVYLSGGNIDAGSLQRVLAA